MPQADLPPLAPAVGALLGAMQDHPSALARDADFLPLVPATDHGTVAAVDGGQSLVAGLGSCGVVALRAGFTMVQGSDPFEDAITFNGVVTVTRRTHDATWARLVREQGWDPDATAPVPSGHNWLRAWCDAARGLAELGAARRALGRLGPDDILLMDGALDADATHPEAAANVLAEAGRRGVHVVALSKDTALSHGGTLPFTMELEAAARDAGAPGRVAVDVTKVLRMEGPVHVWGARFDARAPVYRVDVAPAGSAPPTRLLERVLAACNDVAYPGYPYALARVHEMVHYPAHASEDLKRELEALVAQRRGNLFSMRVFSRGRDVLALGG